MAWETKENDAVVKMLALVCEVTNTKYTEPAQRLILSQLERYPAKQVLSALERCAGECKGRLTLADVVSRLDDGRPGAEEAWASFPKDEREAGVVTQEMSIAWGVAGPLYEDDQVAARMAFRESYEKAVREARNQNQPVKWTVSPGFDHKSTEAAAIEGMRRKLIDPPHAKHFIQPENYARALYVAGLGPPALPAPGDIQKVRGLVARILDGNGTEEKDQ